MPTIIKEMNPVAIQVTNRDVLIVFEKKGSRPFLLAFREGVPQYGSSKIIDGLWYWNGTPSLETRQIFKKEQKRLFHHATGNAENKSLLTFHVNAKHTDATILAHELFGRAGSDSNREPVGTLGSSTRNKVNNAAVQRANQAFERMGMPIRTRY
jgi:hypothetical protein